MERKAVGKVVMDRLLLAGLAVLLAAPVILVFWYMNQPPSEIASRDDLARIDDDEPVLVTRNLDDDALNELPRFTSLRELHLNFSDVTDSGMARIGDCRTLESLWLNCQQVTDEGLARLSPLENLQELVLVGMPRITSAGLGVVQSMPGLRRLLLVRCAGVDDGVAVHLRGLKLEAADFEQTSRVGDQTALALASMPTLREINLNFCDGVSDEGIEAIAALPALEILLLHGLSRITDRSLNALARAQSLNALDLPLRDTGITEQGIAKLKSALPDCKFNR